MSRLSSHRVSFPRLQGRLGSAPLAPHPWVGALASRAHRILATCRGVRAFSRALARARAASVIPRAQGAHGQGVSLQVRPVACGRRRQPRGGSDAPSPARAASARGAAPEYRGSGCRLGEGLQGVGELGASARSIGSQHRASTRHLASCSLMARRMVIAHRAVWARHGEGRAASEPPSRASFWGEASLGCHRSPGLRAFCV